MAGLHGFYDVTFGNVLKMIEVMKVLFHEHLPDLYGHFED